MPRDIHLDFPGRVHLRLRSRVNRGAAGRGHCARWRCRGRIARRAKRLRLSPLSVGATLAIHDSLQSGTSRFYAEIQRIQSLMDLASGDRPLLFLMDELLHGTNSHDRGVGAVAVLRGLVERGALGLVTTHDLALTESLEVFEGRAQNVHFEDHLEGERLVFDFRLRPGVVTKSNALALMRAIGLDV